MELIVSSHIPFIKAQVSIFLSIFRKIKLPKFEVSSLFYRELVNLLYKIMLGRWGGGGGERGPWKEQVIQ